MARPKTASDDEILEAAQRVIFQRGPDAFTLSEVASEVGLSRAAIILRFKSTRDLKLKLLTQMVERFINEMKLLPRSPGGDNLIEVAAFIGRMIPARANLSSFFSMYSGNIKDKDLAELEIRRGAALQEAISRVMPNVAIEHDSAVLAFMANLSGAIMDWQSRDDEGDASAYLVERTQEWLKLAGVPFTDPYFDKKRKITKAKRKLEPTQG